MQRAVRWLWRLLSYALVAALAAGSVWLYDRLPSGMIRCDVNQWNVAENPRGDVVEAHEEFCDGIANSDTITLDLILKSSRRHREFLAYSAGPAEPTLRWEGNDTLVVNLRGAQEILLRRNYLAGIEILYE